MTDDVKQQIADSLPRDHFESTADYLRRLATENQRLRTALANTIDTLNARGFTQTAHHLTQELNK